MTFDAYGLRIAADDECDVDVVWRNQRVPYLPGSDRHHVSTEARTDGVWTHHVFVYPKTEVTTCRFSISPDGHQVVSQALEAASDSDLLDVFIEPIMRTILLRMGLVSFHAAALVKDHRSILLMGKKGAGKSSLSAALLQRGWSILADDLVRVSEYDGQWCATAGRRQVKFNTDVADALGYRCEGLRRRWLEDVTEPDGNKFILEADGLALPMQGYPIHAIFALQPREPGREKATIVTPPPAHQVHLLLGNATTDPVNPRNPPPTAFAHAVSAVLRQAPVRRITLPDRLSKLASAASALDDFMADASASDQVQADTVAVQLA